MKYLVKVLFATFLVMAFVLAFSHQVYAQDPDTLDVPQGFETLNLAVEGDTTETGEPKNPNRVYRLERGGFYLLNGSVRGNSEVPLRIVAAKGEGPRPIIIPAVDETGEADRAFRPRGDVEVRDLYVSGIDNLGNQATKNMFRCDGTGARVIIDGCFLDYDAQSFVRMNSEEQKLYVTNTIMRNSTNLASTGNGRFIDTRGNTQDTIFVQNSTFYLNTGDVLRAAGGIIKNLIWDHLTLYQGADEADIERGINVRVTNNLFIDWGFEGDLKPSNPVAALADSIADGLIQIDTLAAPDLAAEEDRAYIIKNNVYGWTPEVTAWINSIDTLDFWVFHDVRAQRFIDTYPNMVSENNIMEYPVFTDAPDPGPVVAFAQHHLETNFSDENNPDPRADRNGRAALTEDPNSIGPAPDEYDFDYSTDSQAYANAEGGFPVGDLNWFPDKKAEWEAWVKTGVKKNEGGTVPVDFTLKQNYPNPFNPTTTIAYELNSQSIVKLTVYNALGQKVRTLLNGKRQQPGTHSIQWNGLDDANQPVGSGVYIYRLQAGNNKVQTKKMIFIK